MLVFSILVKLGFWQLERAKEKQQLQQALEARQASAPIGYPELLTLSPEAGLTGYRLKVEVDPSHQPLILLDNQIYQGKVGYLAYQIMQVTPDMPLLLVELGFMPGPIDRRQLPQPPGIKQALSLDGRLYRKSTNPMSEHLLPENGNPMRVQNLNFDELEQRLNIKLAPAVLQPTQLPGSELPHPWQPIPLTSEKHLGYAVQWFSMAGAFAILIFYILIFKRKKPNKPKEK
ncbi:SURF1 family protein [Shewanella sp. AS1]|uniref:SURF1 family protein n=1 Tax=Shewanella sp. AS1 TaxID=2907626 RepID=UPI001F269038|nr:SURF1 family protein [Shewanella sp. AS1]MCE9679736.1 SURF1 family protein [Shewanella sp. AS1]